jgi:hypothetical protein
LEWRHFATQISTGLLSQVFNFLTLEMFDLYKIFLFVKANSDGQFNQIRDVLGLLIL